MVANHTEWETPNQAKNAAKTTGGRLPHVPDAGHMCPSPQAVTPHQRTTPSERNNAGAVIELLCFNQPIASP
jgi:hypothetical protein